LTSTPQPDTTAAHPAPADLTGQELEETIKLAHEWGALKQLPRTGWTRAGIQQPESVAAHTARTAMLAWIIAGLEGANQDRAATLALFHDSQESRTGDLDHVGRNYLQPVGNEQITSDQAAALPQPLAAALGRLVGEYEGRASREAECARDADKLDMLLQALEYREAGWRNLDPFIQTAVTALRTPSGRRLGEAAMVVSPAAWWQGFARGVPKISPGSLNGG
jgi:putative hydrolases of HD superfamily